MANSERFTELMKERWQFLQNTEEQLADREPILGTDLSNVGRNITTPLSLQHVGEQIVETAKSDWTTVDGLNTVIAYLGQLADLWETIFRRHREAVAVLSAAKRRPYCLFLRSFTNVTMPIAVTGARVVVYANEPELDANFATTLMYEAEWLNPVSCMHTDDMQLLIRSQNAMPAFRVRTVNWQGILSDAISSSGSLIFYLNGESAGVDFELDCIRAHGLGPRTVVVYRGNKAPELGESADYAGVVHVNQFLARTEGKPGPAKLSSSASDLLRRLASTATTRKSPTRRLLSMPCEVVDSDAPSGPGLANPASTYVVTANNADAFVNYVEKLPDAFLSWNAISQNMRLRNIQPDVDEYNALCGALQMAFVASTCLGFTASMACTLGLLAKVTSMPKPNPSEGPKRVERYMQILDIAQRFNALTSKHSWGEKIEAFRQSIQEDPFF